jgi:phosphohistidine phosphatase SixA
VRDLLPAVIPAIVCIMAMPVSGQTVSGQDLTHSLQSGGYVIVMRHASSPQTPPTKDAADPDNQNDERQLDAAGKASAQSMGAALRRLHIPVTEVLSSPTYRALQTARYAQLGPVKPVPDLGDHSASMAQTSEAQAKWLREQVTRFPSHGNTFLITHAPNLIAAFPEQAAGVKDGEALVFGPDGKGGAALLARISMDDWQKLQP